MKSFFLFPYLIKLNQTPCFPTVTVWRNISTLAEWKCESGQRKNDLACCQTRTWSGVDSKNEEKFHCFGWWLLIGHRGLTYSFCVIDQVYSTTVLTCSSDDIYSEEPIFINVYVGWRIDLTIDICLTKKLISICYIFVFSLRIHLLLIVAPCVCSDACVF